MTFRCKVCEAHPELESDLKGRLECPRCDRSVQDPGYYDIEVKTQPRVSLEVVRAPEHGLRRTDMLAGNAWVEDEQPEFPL